MTQNDHSSQRINASPTKEFFIHMLTRDIPLSRAILDLVDNSVDGAKRLRRDGDYSGLWIRIELDGSRFSIKDNCGGIPVQIARDYAFRFGRPKDAPATPGSVGQFGVGMKRTFFKVGRRFVVRSTTSSSRFLIDVNVDVWKESPEGADDWHFDFSEVADNLSGVPPDTIGTQIEITDLHDSTAQSFQLENFVSRLQREMGLAHTQSLDRGLAISVNGVPIRFEQQELFQSDALQPAYQEVRILRKDIDKQDGPGVEVKLYAGVGRRELADGGWYVFCNGRMVLRADQTATTVWGNTHNLRQYHADFAFFRGYAFFDSDDPSLLPWTTTKTGVDMDSVVYRAVQQKMIEITKPVIDYLSNLAKEKSDAEDGNPIIAVLQDAYQTAKPVSVHNLPKSAFVAPARSPLPPTARMQKIQHSRSAEVVEKAKRLLKVSTYTAVGERTFDYYMENEGLE